MSDTRLLIFDDGRGRFGPLTDLRAAFSLRTGATNNRVRLETRLGVMATDLVVESAIAALQRERETDAQVNAPLSRAAAIAAHARGGGGEWSPVTLPRDGPVLAVNGRWNGVDAALVEKVRSLAVGAAIVQADGQIIAAHLPPSAMQDLIDSRFAALPASVGAASRQTVAGRVLIDRPWHILDQFEATLVDDLLATPVRPELSPPPGWQTGAGSGAGGGGGGGGVHRVGSHLVLVAPTAKVYPGVVLDAERGPIVIGDRAILGANSVIEGPTSIDRDVHIAPLTTVRAHTSIGPVSKVGGEISYTIIQGYSNKSHLGYLGHALVGEWVNLGADTNVSNLKNTYGTVRVQLEPGGAAEETGRMFHGPIIGDFVRTAIGTRLLTGSCVGTGAMIATSGFAEKHVPRMTFVTDAGAERYDPVKFFEAARAMMKRRERVMTPAEEARLGQLLRG